MNKTLIEFQTKSNPATTDFIIGVDQNGLEIKIPINKVGAKGADGAGVQLQYSVNGLDSWHFPDSGNDKFMRIRLGVEAWSTPFRIAADNSSGNSSDGITESQLDAAITEHDFDENAHEFLRNKIDSIIQALSENGIEIGGGGGGEPSKFIISASVSPAAGGNIIPAGNISVNQGSDRTFNFNAFEGFKVSKVLIDGIITELSDNSYTFGNVQNNHSILIEFAPIDEGGGEDEYIIRAEVVGQGSIVPGGDISVVEGDNITFNFFPVDDDFELIDLIVDGISVIADLAASGDMFYKFTEISENHTIRAVFSE